MKTITLIIGAVYGLTSVILGAFGAHALKKVLSVERLTSFETGIAKTTAWFIILGTFLFSVSIYLLSFQEVWGVNLKFLGPITPLGGLLMITGWALLIYVFAKTKF